MKQQRNSWYLTANQWDRTADARRRWTFDTRPRACSHNHPLFPAAKYHSVTKDYCDWHCSKCGKYADTADADRGTLRVWMQDEDGLAEIKFEEPP